MSNTGYPIAGSDCGMRELADVDNGFESFEAEIQPGLWRRGVARIAAAGAPAEPRIESHIDAALAARWDELALRVGASPYLRPGWIEAWWRAFGAGRLEIRTLERDGRLIAVLPLARRLGALRSVTNPHTPEFGLLAEDRPAAVALARSIFHVEAPRRVTVESLDSDLGLDLDACRRGAADAGFRISVRLYQRSPYLRLDGDWERYQSLLGAGFVAGLRRSRRQLERMGDASVEISDGRTALDDRLAEAFAVESSGWKGARGTAIRAHAQTREFYTSVARWAAANDMLRLYFLRLDGKTLAMYFALEQDGVFYLLKGGYDPAFGRVSPGKLLLHRLIEHACRSGAGRIEFHGGAESYKLRFTETVRDRVVFEAFAGSPAGALDWALFRYVRPAVKRLLGRPPDDPGTEASEPCGPQPLPIEPEVET